MTEPAAQPSIGVDPPEATITQTGRWTYRVEVHHKIWTVLNRTVVGRQRAEKCARRKLARVLVDQQRSKNTLRTTVDDLDRTEG